MSSSDSRWVELASQNERVWQAGESGWSSTDQAGRPARDQWAELASHSERLAADSDPVFQDPLCRPVSPRLQETGMRLVAGAA
jgi:hypothetical protein